MFEVLVYMFENYFEADLRPDQNTLASELFAAGFDPVLNTWLSKITPTNRKGAIFGLAQMAKSCGMTIGPGIGGIIARVVATRAVFWVSAVIFLLFIPLMLRCDRVMTAKSRDTEAAE